MPGPPGSNVEQQSVRRARYFFYALGGIFTALALALDLVPSLASAAPDRAVKGCALLAIVLLSLGRFSPDRWVLRLQGMFTGWP